MAAVSGPSKSRSEIIDDIVAAEGRYLRSLRTLIGAFSEPMSRILSEPERRAIFRNVGDLRDTHAAFKAMAADASEEDSAARAIAALSSGLMRMAPTIEGAYARFLVDDSMASRALADAKTRGPVRDLLSSIAVRDERVGSTPLEDFLARPARHVSGLRDAFQALADLSPAGDKSASDAASCRDVFASILRQQGGAQARDDGPAARSMALYSAAASSATAAQPRRPARAPPPPTASPPAAAAYSPPAASAGYPSASPYSQGGSAGSAARLREETSAAFAPRAPRSDGGVDRSGVAATAEARASAAVPDPPYDPGVSGGLSASAADPRSLTERDVDRARDESEDAERRVAAAEAAVATGRDQLRQAQDAASLRSREAALLDTEAERDAVEAAMGRLREEEAALYDRLAGSANREMFESFLRKKRELQAEEDRLAELLERHEQTLAELRERLASPPEEVLPSDPAKRQLYVAWKAALRDREDILRQARARKHRLMRDLREQHETQVILLEMQRRAAVDGLREAVEEERRKADGYRRELADLDRGIEEARGTMKSFRKEFEDLRVALLVDRMAKASQVATLTQRRKQLEDESRRFRDQVEAAKERVAAEEASKWEAKLQSVKEEGARRVEQVRARGRERLERIRADMARSFEESFRPLLQDAEERHRKEMEAVEGLRRELREKEAELGRAERKAAAAAEGDAADADAAEAEPVPAWRQREFDDLKRYVTDMWERLEVPDEDVLAFLSECEMLAPFDERVLEMYRDMYSRLADGHPDLMGPDEAEEEEEAGELDGGDEDEEDGDGYGRGSGGRPRRGGDRYARDEDDEDDESAGARARELVRAPRHVPAAGRRLSRSPPSRGAARPDRDAEARRERRYDDEDDASPRGSGSKPRRDAHGYDRRASPPGRHAAAGPAPSAVVGSRADPSPMRHAAHRSASRGRAVGAGARLRETRAELRLYGASLPPSLGGAGSRRGRR